MRLIEGAPFSILKSYDTDKKLFDAGVETTTLTVRSGGTEQVYSVRVYGHTALEPYYKFLDAVWAFEKKHVPFKSDG